MVKSSGGKKVVLTSHSMGSQIVLYFFKWVTTEESLGGGGGGKDWVERHVHSFVNIAGPILGVPKAVTALLSGEMKDTAIMGTMGAMMERIFGRNNRKEMWKTWGSLWAMLPKGGDTIWSYAGDIVKQPNTEEGQSDIGGADLVAAIEEQEEKKSCSAIPEDEPLITFDDIDLMTYQRKIWSVDDSIKYLQHWGEELKNSVHAARVHRFQSTTHESSTSMEYWHDPTVTSLPDAPSMTIYCLYGVGIETERAYFYKRYNASSEEDLPFLMDPTIHDPNNNIRFGTKFSDGDVSVPLVSLGYMCADGWRDNQRLNPSGVNIITREFLHQEEFRVNDPMRGGPHSADHVDILGNVDTTLDLLKIVTDFDLSTVKVDSIASDIKGIARRINSITDFKTRQRYSRRFTDRLRLVRVRDG